MFFSRRPPLVITRKVSSCLLSTTAAITSPQRNFSSTTTIVEDANAIEINTNNNSISTHESSSTITNEIVLENVEETSFTGSNQNSGNIHHHHTSHVCTPSEHFIDCHSLDPYAKAKITNFLKRISKIAGFKQMSVPQHQNQQNRIGRNNANAVGFLNQHQESSTNNNSNNNNNASFETFEISSEVFRSRMILPLPPQFGLRIAEGEANNAKDAEVLAAMHASQILDELGFQLYTLASMQKKHATQVRSQTLVLPSLTTNNSNNNNMNEKSENTSNSSLAGTVVSRWAPMPDDPLRSPDTPSPPPLRRRSAVDETENGLWMVVDLSVGGLAGSANNLPFLAPDHTLLSPFIVDPAALGRVRALWRSLNPNSKTQDLPISIRQVATVVKNESGSGGDGDNDSSEAAPSSSSITTTIQMTVAEIRLSDFVSIHNGPAHIVHQVAQGKAPDKTSASILAAMHLELILDAGGIPLYPHSKERQQQHAEAARQFGRPLGAANNIHNNFVCPLPLKGTHRLELSTNAKNNNNNGIDLDNRNSSLSAIPIITSANSTGEQWVARNVVLLSLDDSIFRNVDPQSAFDYLASQNNNNNLSGNGEQQKEGQNPVDEILEFLASSGESRPDPFISIKMPDGRVRTAVVLPSVQGLGRDAIYGGVAEAANRKDSRLLAAQHALDVLNTLGVLVHPGDHDKQSNHEERRNARGKISASKVQSLEELPAPMRLIGLNFSSASNSSKNNNNNNIHNNFDEHQPDQKLHSQQPQTSTIFYDLPPPKPAVNEIIPSTSNNNQNQKQQQKPVSRSIASGNTKNENQEQQQMQQQAQDESSNLRSLLVDPNDQFIRTTQAPPHYWDMRPNSPDGFILVESKPVAATGMSYSVSSVRNIDPNARDRLGALAARVGKSALDIVTTYTALTKENTVYFSTQIEVPSIPGEKFGVRIAIGEAQDQLNSEILACMHAETILDRLGLPVFPYDDELQRKHAETTRSLGRYAVMPGESPIYNNSSSSSLNNNENNNNTFALPSPPPLRMRSLQQLVEIPTQPLQGRGSHYLQLPMELYNSAEALDPSSTTRVQFYLRRHRRTVVIPDVFSVQDNHGVNVHVAILYVPTSSSIDNNNNNTSSAASDMNSSTSLLSHQVFGRRIAVGVAEKRKDAETLCFMHAEQIIDALGVPIFPLDSLQKKHSQRVSKLFGRRAVTFTEEVDDENDSNNNNNSNNNYEATILEKFYLKKSSKRKPSFTVNPETVVTPPALRLDVNAVVKPKVIPQPDNGGDDEEHTFRLTKENNNQESFASWQEYVRQAEAYSDQSKKCDRHAKLAADRVPRTGDALVDDALEEAEATEVHRDVRNHLITYCVKMNVEYSQNWNTVQIGTATIRKSFTRVAVPGFPHVEALGVANNKEMSMRKAAHHALQLLKRLDPDFYLFEAEVLSPTALSQGMNMMSLDGSENNNNNNSNESSTKNPRAVAAAQSALRSQNERQSSSRKNRGPDHGSYDRISGSFTTDGKIRLVGLYTLCNGLAAPIISHREKVENGRRVQYTTVEVADLNGSRIIGWAQEGGKKTNEPAAYDDLVQTLLKRVPQFASLAKLLKTHPHLDPEHIVHLELPNQLEQDLRKLLQEDEIQQQEHQQLLLDQMSTTSLLDQEEGAQQKNEAQVASKHADDILSTLDAATNLLLNKSREVKSMDPMASQRLNAFLKVKLANRAASKQYKEKFLSRRESLSIFAKKQEILGTVKDNPVTILCGTTGCGKTTQVPQYLLESEIENGTGSSASIIVTQPRRISAISIAQRVAAERLEPIGQTVGYTVRLDSKPGSSINFCTSGVLLRLLQSSPTIDHIKYLIIDEIHERDINSDFLLILVKRLIQKRSDLRVILMSATLQSELFAGFFGGAPVINVEGYVYPCQELFLDDIAKTCKEREIVTPTTKLLLEGKEEVATLANNNMNDNGFNYNGNNNNNNNEDSSEQSQQQQPQKKVAYGTLEAPTEIDFPLIAFTIEHARKDFDLHGGSILVFLPGWEEITRIRDMFTGNPQYLVLPLHSSVSAEEQLRCFHPPPDPSTVKLILSTNIAESGVTIDDIGCVIDSGRAKEKTYLSRRGRTSVGRKEMGTMSQLVQVLASRANVTQRRGRVGRTRPGVCMKLYSRRQFEELPDFATPEILRQPLDALCLQIMALKLGDPLEFLSLALEPPPPHSIEAAMTRLFHLGAVNDRRQLSPLGLRLALLPVSPKVGKMILYGAALQCLDSALTLAACADVDPFVSQREMKDLVKMSKSEFSSNSLSDPVSNVNAYYSWVNSKISLSSDKVTELENNRCLSKLSLTTISKYKEQYYEILKQSGFLEQKNEEDEASAPAVIKNEIPPAIAVTMPQEQEKPEKIRQIDQENNSNNNVNDDDVAGDENLFTRDVDAEHHKNNNAHNSPTSTSSPPSSSPDALQSQMHQPKPKKRNFFTNGEIFVELSSFSVHANSLPLLKALLCSGLFPNVALFRDKRRFRSKLQNMLHPFPSSVVSKLEEDDVASPFFVYDEMVKTAGDPRVFFRNVTNCSVWAIILLGASGSHTHVEFRHDLNLALVDDWLVFRVTADALELIQYLKHKFLACIEKKFTDPSDEKNNELLSRLQKIIQTLVTEPVRPNDLTTNMWEERGELVEVDVSKLLSEVDRVPLTQEQIEEKERKDREQIAAETMEAAEELQSDKSEKEDEHRNLRVGLAEDEEDN